MTWSGRRKLLYSAVAGIIVLAVLLWFGVRLLSRPASCFDSVQNQKELGVDCGGPCSRICSDSVRPPIVQWTRILQTGTSTYTAVAYIQNPNAGVGAASYGVKYAFRLFDRNNVLVIERDGVIDMPPQQVIPVVEPNIDVGSRTPVSAYLEFSSDTISWTKISSGALPTVRTGAQELATDGSKLSATITNQGNSDIQNLSLVAVLFDASSTAQAASKSVVPRIAPGASAQVVFTWPQGTPNIVRAELTPVLPLPVQ